MDRLTGWDGDRAYLNGLPSFEMPVDCEQIIRKAVERLAAYEDTGLTPEDVKTLHTLTKSYPSILGAAYKLKEYTDTGLTPEVCANYKKFEDEAISKNVTFNRIVELMNAEAEGRLIVPPCKVGDTVYIVKGKRVTECYVNEICIRDNQDEALEYLVSFDCTYLKEDGCEDCPFYSWSQDYSGEWSCNGEYELLSVKIPNKDFGKTVFTSREAAEAALKEVQK